MWCLDNVLSQKKWACRISGRRIIVIRCNTPANISEAIDAADQAGLVRHARCRMSVGALVRILPPRSPVQPSAQPPKAAVLHARR